MHILLHRPDPEATPKIQVNLEAVTVFVGPNGAGKSLLLRQICSSLPNFYGHGNPSSDQRILNCIHLQEPRESIAAVVCGRLIDQVARHIDAFRRPSDNFDPPTERLAAHLCFALRRHDEDDKPGEGSGRPRGRATLSRLIEGIPGTPTAEAVAEHLLAEHLLHREFFVPCRRQLLTLRDRINLPQDQESQPLSEPKASIFTRLLKDRNLLAQINAHVRENCGFELLIDATNLRTLRLVTTATPPPFSTDSIPTAAEHIRFLTAAPRLSEQSDGIQLFVATIIQAFSTDADFILIDEPETSLHPPMAHRLGQILTNLAEERKLSLIVATHSPDFLAGCVSTGNTVSICRLEYRNSVGTAHPLAREDFSASLADPFIRSTGVLNALFHRAVIICEGGSDRLLYSDINNRLILHDPSHPSLMRDCIFIDVGGKDGFKKTGKAIRAMGVPFAYIVDLDILSTPAKLRPLIDIPPDLEHHLAVAFSGRTSKDWRGGLNDLSPEHVAIARHAIAHAADRGVFIVDVGALEDWFPHLGIPTGERKKPDFVAEALDRLGPIDTGTAPSPDGIWAFMRQIAHYLDRPAPVAYQVRSTIIPREV